MAQSSIHLRLSSGVWVGGYDRIPCGPPHGLVVPGWCYTNRLRPSSEERLIVIQSGGVCIAHRRGETPVPVGE